MTQTPAASTNRFAPAQHPAPTNRSPSPAEPPRQQAETRAARDRFAARLDRDGPAETGKAEREEGKAQAGSRERVQEREGNGSGFGDGEQKGGGDAQPELALAQPAAALFGAAATAAVAEIATPLMDPALLERMAAQIAEHWPAVGLEAAHVQFPEGAVVQSALLTRGPDGAMAIRLTGLDPRVTAVQSARLQLDLANALSRRRLRIGSLQFESAPRAQRDYRGAEPGTASVIDRVV